MRFGTFRGINPLTAQISLAKRKRDVSPDGFEPLRGEKNVLRGHTGTEGYQVSSNPSKLMQHRVAEFGSVG